MGFFSNFFNSLGVRIVKLDLEADLYEPGGDSHRKMGEFEYKMYDQGDGDFEIEISRRMELPVGQPLTLCINDQPIYECKNQGGKVDVNGTFTADEPIVCQVGDKVTVLRDGAVILAGRLELD